MSDVLDRRVDHRLLGEAFALAAEVHADQKRKGPGQVPYLAHLLSVAALAFEHGASDAEAAAALLHDAVEDGGGRPVAERIRERCGDEVAAVVVECSDSFVDTTAGGAKAPWEERKRAYIRRLGESGSDQALLVSACDKLHNLTATVEDLAAAADRGEVWARFKTGWQGQRWYYGQLADCYERAGDARVLRVAGRLRSQIARLDAVIRADGHDPADAEPPFPETAAGSA